MDLFAVCLPGLEPFLAEELAAAGLGRGTIAAGGVAFRGDRAALYRAHLELGTATAVLVRIDRFRATARRELERKVGRLPWREWLDRGRTVGVRASCTASRLYHSGAVEERVRAGIRAALGTLQDPPDDEPPDQIVRVRLHEDVVTLSLDATGDPLYRRGYRLDVGKAPLRPDIARALVLASGWDRASPLVDPFCGSGTIAIEAALLAARRPPGALRAFAFQAGPLFDEALFDRTRDTALGRVLPDPAPVVASDRDAGAVERTVANAERAQIAGGVSVSCAAVSDAPFLGGTPESPPSGAVVTNPPYGRRVGDAGSLRSLYQTLGARFRSLPDGWRLALLAADERLGRSVGVPLETGFVIRHGGVRVRAMRCRGDLSS